MSKEKAIGDKAALIATNRLAGLPDWCQAEQCENHCCIRGYQDAVKAERLRTKKEIEQLKKDWINSKSPIQETVMQALDLLKKRLS